MTDVFVSYTSADRPLATALVQSLAHKRLQVFWDRQIPTGKKWSDVLKRELHHANCVVVLLTRNSLASSWVTYEASVAHQQRILIPLLLDPDLNPYQDLPEMYRDLHVTSLPNDLKLLSSSSAQDPWLKAILNTVKRQRLWNRMRKAAYTGLFGSILVIATYVALTSHNALITWQTGLRYIERGAYSKEENERLKAAIRQATLVELLVPNAVSFTSAFRDDLFAFFAKGNVKMRVLFADPNNEFYDAMMSMTTKGIEEDAKASASDKGLPDRSKRLLLSFADKASDQLEFKQFATEFRLPIILIDRRYCFSTIRLTPDQSTESLRIELMSESAGTLFDQTIARALKAISTFFRPSSQNEDSVESCKRHFDSVWTRSKNY
jgi:TIR domain